MEVEGAHKRFNNGFDYFTAEEVSGGVTSLSAQWAGIRFAFARTMSSGPAVIPKEN